MVSVTVMSVTVMSMIVMSMTVMSVTVMSMTVMSMMVVVVVMVMMVIMVVMMMNGDRNWNKDLRLRERNLDNLRVSSRLVTVVPFDVDLSLGLLDRSWCGRRSGWLSNNYNFGFFFLHMMMVSMMSMMMMPMIPMMVTQDEFKRLLDVVIPWLFGRTISTVSGVNVGELHSFDSFVSMRVFNFEVMFVGDVVMISNMSMRVRVSISVTVVVVCVSMGTSISVGVTVTVVISVGMSISIGVSVTNNVLREQVK